MPNSYLRQFCVNITEILSIPTNYQIPLIAYQIAIMVYFLQIFSTIYIYDDESETNVLQYIFSQGVQITAIQRFFILIDQSGVFWVFYALIHFYLVVFVVINAYLSVNVNHNYLLFLNTFYNTFLSWFSIIFYEIYIEVNAHVLYNHALILGIIGLVLIVVFDQGVCYLSQNFQFKDNNLFKRNISLFSLNQILKLISRLTIIEIIQIPSVHLFGIIALYNSIYQRPFTNVQICRWYIICSACFESALIVQTLQLYAFVTKDDAVVSIIVFSLMSGRLGSVAHQYLYMDLLQNKHGISVFAEELIELYHNDVYNLLLAYRHHVNNCNNVTCFCIKYGSGLTSQKEEVYKYRELNQRFTKELKLEFIDIIKLLESLFQVHLQRNSKDKHRCQFVYMSFMEKYSGNQLLSYFFLKKIPKNEFNYFHRIANSVVCYVSLLKMIKQLESEIIFRNEQKRQVDEQQLKIEVIVTFERTCLSYHEKFLQIINAKLQVWQVIEAGNDTIKSLLNDMMPPLNKFIRVKGELQDMIGQLEVDRQCAPYLKVLQLYALSVTNQFSKIQALEQQMQDLRNRDQYKEDSKLNNYNFMKGQSVIIRAGLSNQIGKILNKENDKIRKFFGYTATEMQTIDTINELMPKHISILHNQILTMYLQKGESPLLYTTRSIFIVDSKRYLFPVSITVRNDFSDLDDCVFNVNLLKVQSKELIMFDAHGLIIGISEKLFGVISHFGDYFTYEDLTQKGYIQIFMPSLLRILEQISPQMEIGGEDSSYSFENLQCSLYQGMDQFGISRAYGDRDLQLLDPDHRKVMRKFLSTQIRQMQTKVKARFRFNSFYRQFNNLDLSILHLVGQRAVKHQSLHYFVLEVLEIQEEIMTQSRKETENFASFSYSKTSASQSQRKLNPESVQELDEQEEDRQQQVSESKGNIQIQNYDQVQFPQFQIDSPKDSTFIHEEFKLFRAALQDNFMSHPQLININLEEGCPDEFDNTHQAPPEPISKKIGSLKESLQSGLKQQFFTIHHDQIDEEESHQRELQFSQGVRSPHANPMEASSTSVVSKSDREHLDDIYESRRMPMSFISLLNAKLMIIFLIVLAVVIQIIVVAIQLNAISSQGSRLKISYQFNRDFVDVTQQRTYLYYNMTTVIPNSNVFWQTSINASIADQISLLNNNLDSFHNILNNNRMIKVYETTSLYVTQQFDIYSFQSSNLQYFKSLDYISLFNLHQRIIDNEWFNRAIINQQLVAIQNEADKLITILEIVIIVFAMSIVVLVFPIMLILQLLNGYIEKIVLLVTRINLEEYQREIQRLLGIIEVLSQQKGISIISNDYVQQILTRKLVDQRSAKSNLLQTKIYNIRLPITIDALKYLIPILIGITYLFAGLLYANQVPGQYVSQAKHLSNLIQIYQNISYGNLVYDNLQRKITLNVSELNQFQKDNVNLYENYLAVIEQQDTYYHSNLCNEVQICNTLSMFYQNGIAAVVQNLKVFIQTGSLPQGNEYYAIISFYPTVVQPFIDKDIELQSQSLITLINQLQLGLTLYITMAGSTITLLIITLFFISHRNIYNRIKSMQHLLIWIPMEKLTEEITISMLKSLRQY